MDAVKREQRARRARGRTLSGPLAGCACSTSARASPRRSAPGCSASRAPRSSRSSSPAAATSCARSARSSTRRRRRPVLAVLGRRGPRPQERHARPAHRRRPGPASAGSPRRPTWWSRTSGPARSSTGTSRPATSTRGSSSCASRCSARTARTRRGPGLDRVGIGYGGLLHLTGYPDRPPVRVGVTISDYLTGVFAAQAAVGALYAATRARRQGRGHRRRALRRRAAHPRVDARRLRPARHRAQPRGQPARQLGAARQLPDRATASTCASSPAPTPTSRGCARRWTDPTCSTIRASPSSPIAPRTAT